MEIPSYIKDLAKVNGKTPAGRKVWSIDLETVWLPFFRAMTIVELMPVSPEALGAPLRLAYNPDRTVKFSKTGRPVVKVVGELADSIRLVRENFVAKLVAFANGVVIENPEGYKALVKASIEAGQPIVLRDRTALTEALAVLEAQAKAQAQAQAQAVAEAQAIAQAQAEAPKPKAKAPKGKPQAQAEAQPQPEAPVQPERELVAVS